MQIDNDNSDSDCLRLQEFLDGEMPASERREFGAHFSECENCRIEVELRCEIQTIPEDIALPKDFSKVVAARAESQVIGLRRQNERSVALAIVSGLAVLVFIVLGANFRYSSGLFAFALERLSAFLTVIGGFLFDLVLGIVIIVKVATAQFGFPIVTVAGVFAIVLGSLLIYRFYAGRISSLRNVNR